MFSAPWTDYDNLEKCNVDATTGYYCFAGEQTECPEGYRCPNQYQSVAEPCPTGFYQPDSGKRTVTFTDEL